MEGLRPRQQKAQNDRPGRRIPTSVPAARVAAWLCAHPPFRLSVRTATARVHCHQPPSVDGDSSTTLPNADDNVTARHHLAMLVLWRRLYFRTETHRQAGPP